MELKKYNLSPELKRYLVIGIGVYVFELAVIVTAQKLGANDVLAVGLSFWFGLSLSFLLQKIVTFGDKRMHNKVLISQVAAFSLLVLFNFSFTVIFTRLLSDLLPAIIIRTLTLAATTIWNFYLYKTRIFKNQREIVH